MNELWTKVDPPENLPSPAKIRGIPNLAASDYPDFPETIPFAGDSILRVKPRTHCESPEQGGALARQIIDSSLNENPAILFKEFGIENRQDFSVFIQSTELPLHDYKGGNALRDKSDDKVSVTSTESADVVVTPHNENAYMPEPPDMVFFCCIEAAEVGGEVPINDARKTAALLSPQFVEEMRRRDLRYIRRLSQEDSWHEIGWETSFNTNDESVVENYLEQQGIEYFWNQNGSLEFWFNTEVFREYRGEEVWFNQLSECNADYWLYHPDGEAMDITRETCQSDTAYGDGEPFDYDTRAKVRAAIWQTTELIKLEPGDVILLDNNLIQHGRMAFKGVRKHLAALALRP